MLRIALLAGVIAGVAAPTHAVPYRINAIVYPVQDVEKSAAYYEKTFGFKKRDTTEESDPSLAPLYGLGPVRIRTSRLRLGEDDIALVQFLTPKGGRPIPADSRSQDLWFQHFAIIVSDMGAAHGRVAAAHSVPISRGGPQKLPANTGGVTAFKFKDPDNHPLELLYLPPGVGRPVWHTGAAGPFLGIDHSAIGVSNTAKSLAFYRDLLGFEVTGTSLNQGPEQARLDNADGAIVEITGLRVPGATGPGIELLQYRQPADGRATPANTRANDLWASQIGITVDGIDVLAGRLQAAGVRFVSPGVVSVSGQPFTKALLVLDPDGHHILLTQ